MELMDLNNEKVIEIWYFFALDKPKPKISLPQEEWISVLKSLSHLKNLKAKTFVAAFFNGDIKLIDGKDGKNDSQKELFIVSKLHEDKISDLIYLKCDNLNGRKFIISCSEVPYPQLKISEVNTSNTQIKVVCQAS